MFRRLVHHLLLAVVLVTVAAAARPGASEAQANCEFVLGFRVLHDMIPQIVGSCLESEWHNWDNGDGLQQTTGGLMVWRKLDNWTAFTDGYTTWINGPFGLQSRLNTERFAWEGGLAPPAASPPPPEPGPAPLVAVPSPTDTRPGIELRLPDGRVNQGETFKIRIEATDDRGIESMWWWASFTNDDGLRDTHTFECNGANPCRKTWEEETDDTGRIVIHAMARDTAGQMSDEVTVELRVSEPSPTPTPTPTPTVAPAKKT